MASGATQYIPERALEKTCDLHPPPTKPQGKLVPRGHRTGMRVVCTRACLVASFVSDSLRLYGPQPTRLLCPWDSPGKSTGVGSHACHQEISTLQTHVSCIAGGFCTTEPTGPLSRIENHSGDARPNSRALPKHESETCPALGVSVTGWDAGPPAAPGRSKW